MARGPSDVCLSAWCVGDPMDASRIGNEGNSPPVECIPLVSAEEGPLPLLASSCPGWVCYAEKTQGAAILPHISSAKSPQAVQGTAVKRWLAPGLLLASESIYHCAVMMCYDKKLEAAREDFMLPGTNIPKIYLNVIVSQCQCNSL